MAGLPQLMLLRRGMPCSQQSWWEQHQTGGYHYHRTPVVLGQETHTLKPLGRESHKPSAEQCLVPLCIPKNPTCHPQLTAGGHLPAHS